MQNAIVLNWSSGKDAAMAYHLLSQDNRYQVAQLLTTINDEQDRVVMHGVRKALLDMQAQRMGVPLKKIKLPPSPSDVVYKTEMEKALTELKGEGITTAAFGDIFLEDLRKYREAQLASIGMSAVFPLWKKSTYEMAAELEAIGIKATIVCVDGQKMSSDFLGRTVDKTLLGDLPEGVDPCGENGEFHTFVTDAPFFSEPVNVKHGEVVHKTYNVNDGKAGFYFLDLLPAL